MLASDDGDPANESAGEAQQPNIEAANGALNERMDESLDRVVDHIKALVPLPGFDVSHWTEEHSVVARDFCATSGRKILFVYWETDGRQLRVQTTVPRSIPSELAYFVTDLASEEQIDVVSFNSKVHYGLVQGSNVLRSLLSQLEGIFFPTLYSYGKWHRSIRTDFLNQFQRLMATLTEGRTVLYVPKEVFGDISKDAMDKDLIVRLESLVVQWTKQIKEVLNSNQNASESGDRSTPIDEINYWKARCDDLSGIYKQLHEPHLNHILDVLELAKSPYIEHFRRSADQINQGTLESQDNLKFLNILVEPCQLLDSTEPKDILSVMPKLVHLVRFIWKHSKYYNSDERIMGLIQKINNQVINRCIEKISLEDIFLKDVLKSVAILEECTKACEAWKGFYLTMTARFWHYDENSIFAQLDAFVQRCTDLLEVCEAQDQFARKTEGGEKLPLPQFGNSQKVDLAKGLEDIENTFQKLLAKLWALKEQILDVKGTKWYDEYNTFKQGIKDLEVMMQNLITTAFEINMPIARCLETLEIFHGLAKREAIRRTVEKKSSDMWNLLTVDLNAVKNTFETCRKNPELLRTHPDYAGSAYWARALQKRIQYNMSLFNNAYFLPTNSASQDARSLFDSLSSALEEYITKTHREWTERTDLNAAKGLEKPILTIENKKNFSVNFDKNIMRILPEITYFQKLKCDIPFQLLELYRRRDDLRIIRENVLIICRDFNEVLEKLTPDEQLLFKERLKVVEKKLKPGLTKLTWDSKAVLDVYLKDCRKAMTELQATVAAYIQARNNIKAMCQKISECILFHIEPQKIYSLDDFTRAQFSNNVNAASNIKKILDEIDSSIKAIYEYIKNDGKDIHSQWTKFVSGVDRNIASAFKDCIKVSLHGVSRTIVGESKGRENTVDVQPVIGIEVILDNVKLEFSPSLKKLRECVITTANNIISVIENFEPFELDYSDTLIESDIQKNVMEDEEFKKIISVLETGIDSTEARAQKYLHTWDSYKEIWEVNKDAFIRRYAKLQPALSTFDADINRYNEVANNIQKEETLIATDFVRIDCSPLKHSLVGHCNVWQNKLTGLLNSTAQSQLQNLHDMMSKNTVKLTTDPSNLDELAEVIQLHSQLISEIPNIEQEFTPLQEKYQILEKYEVPVTAKEKEELATLAGCWQSFLVLFEESGRKLKDVKTRFKSELSLTFDELQKNYYNLRDEVTSSGPYKLEVTAQLALSSLASYKATLDEYIQREESIRKGLLLFSIDEKSLKDGEFLVIELETLQALWTLVSEWDVLWDSNSNVHMDEINLKLLEEEIQKFSKKLGKFGKECKDWDVYTRQRDKINQLRKLIPLLNELKNKAIRPRHWKLLMTGMNQDFDPKSPTFNLQYLTTLSLENHQELIFDISAAASKELSIEVDLVKIGEAWKGIGIDIVSYKEDKGFMKIKSVETIMEALEDNQVSLSSMKASKFSTAFEPQIIEWEKKLSTISELVEALLQVQKRWMYLENIFIGTEDIRKQLPKETAIFEKVNEAWSSILHTARKYPNVLAVLEHKDLVPRLVQMNSDLEKIQKSLEMYLETKRQAFPRFFFISNEDLLEILGQARDPNAIQPHFKKLFDNIHKVEIKSFGMDQIVQYEGLGMYSGDGEYVKFGTSLKLDGPVENWLLDIENMMRSSLKKILPLTIAANKKSKRDKWIREWPGQLLITTSLILWTHDCTKALNEIEKGDKEALRVLRKKQASGLKKLAELVLTPLTKVERKRLMSLITIEVHSRDVIEKMIKTDCADASAFEWLSQLRFYWERGDEDDEDCFVRQINTKFSYGYEYLGNSGRLVITPLTDRCYMTLTTALNLFRGGSPQGPAGTGKTETVKDLGKSLGKYVIVQNCSETLDFKSIGRMFSGIAQTGVWGCFDEFNRINIEVLSVVAQQISLVLSAMSRRATTFIFEGREIKLNGTCGIFITMNPGYAGRSELPDNLKALFRPVAMMVPDSALIAEIMLFAEGFSNAKVLSKKVESLYRLAAQQLSKQNHYDFNLRSLTAALRSGGAKKRQNPNLSDEVVLYIAMRDNNLPKLTSGDAPLFNSILSDLFPALEIPHLENTELREASVQAAAELGIEGNESLVSKVSQLYETKSMRHGVMLLGSSCSGKTTIWQTLECALGKLSKTLPEKYNQVRTFILNPKAVGVGELYGEFNLGTNEWTDGIISSIIRIASLDDKPDLKWIIFDGPVDTLWIESMNSVLDDNKILTLVNGERIALTDSVSLLFEVEDLSAASPATVSRAGMVYIDYKDLGWKPPIESWLKKKADLRLRSLLKDLVTKYLEVILDARSRLLEDTVKVPELAVVKCFCNLCDSLMTAANGVDPAGPEADFNRFVELWFVFSAIWAFGGPLKEESRKQFDILLRSIDGRFPTKDTVFEYYVKVETKNWGLWEEQLSGNWKYPNNIPSYRIYVPTVDSLRNEFVIRTLLDANHHVMLVGNQGTGKTSLVNQILDGTRNKKSLCITMSAETSSLSLQQTIESRIEKRTKNIFVPIGGKNLVTFVDDFNLPSKDTYGSQSPLELLRLWMEHGFLYDRKRQFQKIINGIQIVAAMSTSGGRNVISKRVLSRFNILNVTFPSEPSLNRILECIIDQKLQDFDEDVKNIKLPMVANTLELYRSCSAAFLPTPTKAYYTFSLRDMIKVFHGLLKSDYRIQDSKEAFLKLWVHETSRIFYDRLLTDEDREKYNKILEDKFFGCFNIPLKQVVGEESPVFLQFPNDNDDQHPYQEVPNLAKLKHYFEEKVVEYNSEPGKTIFNIVLFKDAIEHVARICRILTQVNSHGLLLGPGGSGRQTLARLACHISETEFLQIRPTKSYRHGDFREDIKAIYQKCGVADKPLAFVVTEQHLLADSFLEDISNILSNGEVPNLFAADELAELKSNMSKVAGDTEDEILRVFYERVKKNLHILLCLSPASAKFKRYIRMFPAIINCTTIDCFTDWPEDALDEVSKKFLSHVEMEDPAIKTALAQMSVVSHLSVVRESKKMYLEMKRQSYVTPVNFLELLSEYSRLLRGKRLEIGDAATKLRNGLQKLDETKISVEQISKELEQAKMQVAKFQKECDDYLVIIVQQKREADDQAKSVANRAEKLAVEEAEVRVVADAAQADLDQALPALNAAVKALEAINKKDLNEIRSYGKPPALVEKVMEAVMVLKKSEATWEEAKKQLGNPNFIKSLVNFDKDNISDKILKKVSQYCSDESFQPDVVGRVSGAAKSLCMWVRAMETYGTIYRIVLPKKEKLRAAQEQLEKKQVTLKDARDKLQEIQDKLQKLKNQYDEKLELKEKLRKDSEDMEIKLRRAEQLVSGLSGERVRWEQSIKEYEAAYLLLPGDCLLASAFLSYAGPFDSVYRQNLLMNEWLPKMEELNIPHSKSFKPESFLAKQIVMQEWNSQGLPTDQFSMQNGNLVVLSNRWPLMIDPQFQGFKWVKKMEARRGLKVLSVRQSDVLKQLESAIQYGLPVLLEGIEESIDASLDPIISKAVSKKGSYLTIRLGDKEIEYNPMFRLYMTTKLSNPSYEPEIFAKTAVINFSVKEKGLEDQLLGIVVKKEKPGLEEQKSALIVNVSNAKLKLIQLEDEILSLLSAASGSLLEDVKLLDALQSSKVTSEEVMKQLVVGEQTERRIDVAREAYRPCAERAAILFFVLKDLALIDPMYIFSLDSYIEMFEKSMANSKKSEDLQMRIDTLNKYHTHFVYKNICMGLFEKHKLLFSLQMTLKIMESSGDLNRTFYDFFLRGGIVLDKESQLPNPCREWISDTVWENLTELDKLPSFSGIINAIEQNEREWRNWYSSTEPESLAMPSEWENKLNGFEKMLMVRSFRQDRIVFSARNFVAATLGPEFVDPPILNINDVLKDSSPATPLMFVLSPGIDPLVTLNQLAEQYGMKDKFQYVSLGQGQAPIATRMLQEGMKYGQWIFLANCHLSLSWLPSLEKIIENIPNENPHKDFRLWISSSPLPQFPISILQTSLKMTTEPPKGIKANMMRLVSKASVDSFKKTSKPNYYQKLFFSLCFFHSLLLERKKFLTLGWNIPSDFNDSDFEVSENLITVLLDEYKDVPWDALKYLVAEAHYGGRVTDDWDRRVLRSYISHLFNENAVNSNGYQLSDSNVYVMPSNMDLGVVREYVSSLPAIDKSDAFGQHTNADISSQIRESGDLLSSLLSLQPKLEATGGASRESIVQSIAADLEKKLPDFIDFERAESLVKHDLLNPLNVVLLQEIQRYNDLLLVIRESLGTLQLALSGFTAMTPEIEEIYAALYDGRVPSLWQQAYLSIKGLAAWMRDLSERIHYFNEWSQGKEPKMHWLGAFTFPTGFLTAVLQRASRKNNVPVDILGWEFIVAQGEETQIESNDGVFITGLFLEGAGWDARNGCLKDCNPMELTTPLPPIYLRPVENKKKSMKGIYTCPLYYYPIRAASREKPSFIVSLELKTGSYESDFFIRRGTAALASLG